MREVKAIGIGLIIIVVLFFMWWFEVFDKEETKEQSTPIQNIEEQKDDIKLKIITIDSLQHEKVIEVQGLNNDSTLELFYKLIRE